MIEMQKGLLTLLKELDAICKKHNITYYLEGGSLLGAVRHKGFLPWDDDVDLSITRDNFKKLLSVIDQELPENRELYCYERFPGYLRDTVKYTNLDTTVLFPNHVLDGNAAGQHIDLFVLDPVPSDAQAQEEYKKYATIYSELLTPVYVLCDDIADYREEYEQYRQLMQQKGKQYVLDLLRQKLFTYEDSDECDTYLLRWGNRHIFYPKALFGTPVPLQFEDGYFPAPSQYYRFLRRQFGDSWMIIPDEEHQEDHSTFDNYNLPCKTFIADYAPFIDYAVFEKAYVKRKNDRIQLLQEEKPIVQEQVYQHFALKALELEDIIPALTQEAKDLLEKQDYPALKAYFAPYYTAQLDGFFVNQGLAFEADPQVVYACALALTMCGQFGQGEKLIRASKAQTPELEKLAEAIPDIRACVLATEEQRFDDAKVLAEKWQSQYPLQLDLAVFMLRQAEREGQDVKELTTRTQKLLDVYPESDQLMLLMGQLLEKQENPEAKVWYDRCRAISRNGMILMALPREENEK